MEVLREAVWRQAAGLVYPEELPTIAAEALARGVDSPALRELAGLGRGSDTTEIRDLYLAALEELGISAPSTEVAVRRWLRDLADALVSGRMSATEAAGKLVLPGEAWMTEKEFGFAHLGYYQEEFADFASAEQVSEYENDLREAAQAVVDEAEAV